MEETIKAPTAVFVGKIDEIMYVNLTHEKGITEDTKINVVNQFCTELETEIEYNLTKYNDANRTLKINVGSGDLDDNYFVKIIDADGAESKIVIDTTIEPDALITDNVKVTAYGDRIIEVLFDEPVQNLTSSFDFAADRINSTENIPKLVYVKSAPSNFDHAGKALYECEEGGAKKFAIEIAPDSYEEIDADGLVTGTSVVPDDNTLKQLTAPGVVSLQNPILEVPAAHSADPATKTKGIIRYESPFSETETDNSVLMNFYFRYFGSDDEGTLYEPDNKPLDWLGYFASKDTDINISGDDRRFEVQFKNYSLPTGDTHELIINYAKTFPGYTHDFRIKDANSNNFPIVSKNVPIVKSAKKAAITEIKSLSRTKLQITFDKPVLCLEQQTQIFELKINGKDVYKVERIGTDFNTLVATLKSENALPLGPVEVTIGSITDACGYKTNEVTQTVDIIADPPRVTDIIHIENANDTSILEIDFDDYMDIPVSKPSDHIKIFELDPDTALEKEIFPLLELLPIDPDDSARLKVSEPMLFPGTKYRIEIDKLTNKAGTPMIPFSDLICIGDLTPPSIEDIKITDDTEYTDPSKKDYRHKIVITYDEPMELQGPTSVLNPNNYIILGNTDADWCAGNDNKLILNSSLAKVSIPSYENNNRRVLIEINADALKEELEPDRNYDEYLFGKDVHLVSAGYCDLKTVKYVTDDTGNVLNFACIDVDATATQNIYLHEIDGSLTGPIEIEVIDEQNLHLKFTLSNANNRIMFVSPDDFKIVNGEVENTAIEAQVTATEAGNNIDYIIALKFDLGVLVPNTTLVTTSGKSTDIFNNPVIFDSTPIPTGIINRVNLEYAQVVKHDGHLVTIKMQFDAPVNVAGLQGTSPDADTLAKILQETAHCFALKVNDKDWLSLQNIVSNENNKEIAPADLSSVLNTQTLYFTYDNGTAIFDNAKILLATTASQENMKVVAVHPTDSTDQDAIEVIAPELELKVYWEEPIVSNPVVIP